MKIVIEKKTCLRCGHTWWPRGLNKYPKSCGKCKSKSWNKKNNK